MTLPLTENFRAKVISRSIALALGGLGAASLWMAATSLWGGLSKYSLFLLIFAIPFFVLSYLSFRDTYLMWTGPSVSAMNYLAWIAATILLIVSITLLNNLSAFFWKQDAPRFEGLTHFFSLCAAGTGFYLTKYKLSPFLNIQMNVDWQKKVSARRTYFACLAFFLWTGLGMDLLEYKKNIVQPGESKFFLLGMIISLAVAIIFYYTCTSIFCRRPREED